MGSVGDAAVGVRRAAFRRAAKWSCAVVLAGLAASAAWAQARYACRLPNGSTVVSDRPCTGSASPGMVYYGPVEQPSTPSYYYQPQPGEAPEYLKYMNARCASMSDAVRTAGVRGLKMDAIAELQRNYRKDCAENEQEARVQLNAERQGRAQAKREEKQATAARTQQSQLAQQQCDESKRILVTKRKRTDLSDGEKADLQRFEENYRARCG
jgi:hypothetical protein